MSGGFDAGVVGAGVAGSALAAALARRGHAVVLLDRQRFPRAKPCGGCLHRGGLDTLDRLGLAGCVPADAPAVDAAVVWSGGRATRVPSRHGRVVDRASFDAALRAGAEAAGVASVEGVTARVRPGTAGGWRIDGGRAGAWSVRVVAAADGLGGSCLRGLEGFGVRRAPASRIGLGAIAHPGADDALPPGTVAMLTSARGYLGLTRLGPGADAPVDLAAAVDPALVRSLGGPSPAAAALALEAGAPAAFAAWARRAVGWRATPPLTCAATRLAAPGLRVVGDAGGYLEPFTGEGMAWALDDAEAAAASMDACLRRGGERAADAAAWEAARRRRIAGRQRRCRAAAAVLRRPALTRPALAGAALAFPLLHRLRAAS
ncbi:NAD(P)/FAD-dependent oxidoreductase [Phycisphaera mikurensis]|uniref:Putative oxidoreductase n=1 Tax=Phycisphaera mikurensis (strain NBRC 102666 / KCTC 22515 / FYK2301M01) TaxID=1142394 RepID=I0IGX9_PHYMF|nr:FAD-dependent monooxygenase [Phycisphaera mikurensis]MBB6440774.1 flavin-dependent dehydrogenase [Phycisphaera mikurensis]BAM04517.1 putative oxidoreductase [Phycisphaera mikurensis NBRC 102666]